MRGKAGVRTVIVDRKEVVTQESRNTPSVPGNHVILNINAKLQAAVEQELKNSVLRARGMGYRGDSGAAIVMDIKTGGVLAMASYPDYDLNIWENGITVKQAKSFTARKLEFRHYHEQSKELLLLPLPSKLSHFPQLSMRATV